MSRLSRYSAVSTALALLSDRQLGQLVASAAPAGTGIGGSSVRLDVEDVPVFAKQVALTDLERQPGNVMSTANLFELPPYFQYGVGSPGFGAWRELAAHTMTTNWVLSGQSDAFPLLYHWRVLPDAPAASDKRADVDGAVAYWGGSAAVRARFTALAEASASLVLFLEHIPHSVADWLPTQLTDIEPAAEMVDRLLRDGATVMDAGGLTHFDAHFANVLTDGHRLYFGDMGLATSPRFDLSPDERAFLARHPRFDHLYTATHFVIWLLDNVCGVPRSERGEHLRRYADGLAAPDAPPAVAAIIRRHAPVATVVYDFYSRLLTESRATPFPTRLVLAT
ncbi:serine/threonine protein phosphatase [Micromonospora sp. CPCC 206061]|uniref:serine/threonine protein phosphatase n=1 Tax=Micromonospora sp. CPCC 206061 TaxID=3122410 RepID=UPI002FF25C30